MKQLKQLIFIIGVLAFIWLFVSYKYVMNSNNEQTPFQVTNKANIDPNTYSTLKQSTFVSAATKDIVSNSKSIQITSFLLLDRKENKSLIRIECLLTISWHANKSDFRCLARYKPTGKLYINDVEKLEYLQYSIWIIQCKLNETTDHSNWELAVIDRDILELINANRFHTDYVHFQTPRFVDRSIPKRKAIAHCLSRVYGLDMNMFNRLVSWVEMQKAFGYDKIRFYFHKVKYEFERSLYEKFGEKLIEIKNYTDDHTIICKKQINDCKLSPNDAFFKILLDKCINASKVLNWRGLQAYNDNDCYYNFRYEFEYVTNHDADEIIYPRIFETNDLKAHDSIIQCSNNDSNKLAISILKDQTTYEYANKLFNKFGKTQTAALGFKQVMFLPYSFFDKKTAFQINLPNQKILKFNVSSYNASALLSFDGLFQKAMCLSTMFENSTILDQKYAFSLGLFLQHPHMNWKSIFNTDLTSCIMPHFALKMENNSKTVSVPLIFGHVNHLRLDPFRYFYPDAATGKANGTEIDIKNVLIDFE
jgi:hypothetical protein